MTRVADFMKEADTIAEGIALLQVRLVVVKLVVVVVGLVMVVSR